jgi:hypothetical protein
MDPCSFKAGHRNGALAGGQDWLHAELVRMRTELSVWEIVGDLHDWQEK